MTIGLIRCKHSTRTKYVISLTKRLIKIFRESTRTGLYDNPTSLLQHIGYVLHYRLETLLHVLFPLIYQIDQHYQIIWLRE